MATGLRASGTFADYRGKVYRQSFAGTGWVALELPADAAATEFPEAIGFGDNPRGRWVKLPVAAITRLWRETVSGQWLGADVSIERVLPDGRVAILMQASTLVGTALGLAGNVRDGWYGSVPAEEVEITRIETRELTP